MFEFRRNEQFLIVVISADFNNQNIAIAPLFFWVVTIFDPYRRVSYKTL